MTEQNQQNIAAKYDEIISYIHDQTTQIDNIQTLYYSIQDAIAKINESISNINAVLENHKEVITQLCTKCGIELSEENSEVDIGDAPANPDNT
jgi:wobble nucleotide-excising tRNase